MRQENVVQYQKDLNTPFQRLLGTKPSLHGTREQLKTTIGERLLTVKRHSVRPRRECRMTILRGIQHSHSAAQPKTSRTPWD